MASGSTRSAECEGLTKEEALRAAFEKLGVVSDAWTDDTAEGIRDTAIEVLGIAPNDLTIKVLAEGTKGLLGLGSKPARVRVTIRQTTETTPGETLKQMLAYMGVDAMVSSEIRDGDIVLNIETDDAAILIGRHGHTLDAIQYLLNCIVNKSALVKRRVIVNAGAYREKREDMLAEMAHQAARHVRATGREAVLEPMNPRDRRIIHIALRDDDDVRTFSRGDGPYRAVVIVPRDSYAPNPDEEEW
jgi:spoIIIJ-associated protein